MPPRQEMLESIANTIADYRAGENISPRTPELVNAWVSQFPEDIQESLLDALTYTLPKTYLSQTDFKVFLRGLAGTDKLSPGTNPAEYWKQANFLKIQQGGNSQLEILGTFDEVLKELHNYGLSETGSADGDFIYLDDCIGTGSRVRSDVCAWIGSDAPPNIRLHVVSPIRYRGAYWIDDKIEQAARANGKSIVLKNWRLDNFYLENRLYYRNSSDVLWPTQIPDIQEAQAYAEELNAKGHPVELRAPGNCGHANIFETEEKRMLLEQAFLTRGCQIRGECNNLPAAFRPLGFHNLDTLGFGSMCVTYRNCPNNCPLVFWVEQGGYPALFPRKTNTQTSVERLFAQFN